MKYFWFVLLRYASVCQVLDVTKRPTQILVWMFYTMVQAKNFTTNLTLELMGTKILEHDKKDFLLKYVFSNKCNKYATLKNIYSFIFSLRRDFYADRQCFHCFITYNNLNAYLFIFRKYCLPRSSILWTVFETVIFLLSIKLHMTLCKFLHIWS